MVRRLRAAGAVVLGKTTLCDFAAGWFSYSSLTGDTKNPYEPGRDSGGSSAGSAAAVAANLATIALGTDCGGSVRVPASFCNVVGIRTTPEVVSHDGTLVLVARQDTIGPLARSVADAAALLSVMADQGTSAHAAAAQFTADEAAGPQAIAQARIGVLRDAFGDGHPEMAAVNDVVNRALASAAAAGATLVDVAIPGLRADLEATSMYLLRSRHDVDTWLAGRPGLSVRTVREIHAERLYDPRLDLIDAIAASPDFSAENPEIIRRQAAREAFTAKLEGAMDAGQLDLLAYPTVQVFSPLRAGPAEWTTLTFPTNTVIASQAWMPAMSLPAGLAAGGPVGLELLARQHDEARLLRLGAAIERVTRQRRPPASAPAVARQAPAEPGAGGTWRGRWGQVGPEPGGVLLSLEPLADDPFGLGEVVRQHGDDLFGVRDLGRHPAACGAGAGSTRGSSTGIRTAARTAPPRSRAGRGPGASRRCSPARPATGGTRCGAGRTPPCAGPWPRPRTRRTPPPRPGRRRRSHVPARGGR